MLAFALMAGCTKDDDKKSSTRTLVTPVATQFPYTFKGRIIRIWGGDELEIYDELQRVHWVRLVGAIGPEPNQVHHRDAHRGMWKQFVRKPCQVTVYDLDEFHCELATVVCEEIDLSSHLIETGLGWHDRSEYDKSQYESKEKAARAKGLGIWNLESKPPIHPLDFKIRSDGAFQQKLKEQVEKLDE